MNENLQITSFGKFEGVDVQEYTLRNNQGMEVAVMNIGATLTKITVPDKNGLLGNVLLGFTNAEEYSQHISCYSGSIVGRYANRISGAGFMLNGLRYQVDANEGNNCLHGGSMGFHKSFWQLEPGGDALSIVASYLSKDGEAGFPGNMKVTVTYRLSHNNELSIEYHAVCDKETVINLTSHGYFNLSAGGCPNVLDHNLCIQSDHITALNEQQIPTGELMPVANSAYDFRKPATIGKHIHLLPKGYDINYVLLPDAPFAATLHDPVSGRMMTVHTTEPGLQLYSTNYLFPKAKGVMELYGSVCLEAQHFPDSPNQPGFPDTHLKPGQVYQQLTRYVFSVK